MSKVSIIGAGNVGSQAALFAALRGIDEVVLVDIAEGLAQGKALDIQQAMPIEMKNVSVIGTTDYSLTNDSDIVVITAGVARKPGMSRDDLLEINSKIMKSIIPEVVSNSPECVLIVVSNPLDVMVHLAYRLSGFPRERVIGMAGVLDSARFRTFIAMQTGAKVEEIDAMVLGGHGDQMVPIMSRCTVSGKPIKEFLSPDKVDALIKRVQNGGAEIVSLLKTGSAFFAPGASVAEMVSSILDERDIVLPCSVMLDGEYGHRDVFAGVPVRLGKNGVKEIIEIDLSDVEKDMLLVSVEHIRKVIGG